MAEQTKTTHVNPYDLSAVRRAVPVSSAKPTTRIRQPYSLGASQRLQRSGDRTKKTF